MLLVAVFLRQYADSSRLAGALLARTRPTACYSDRLLALNAGPLVGHVDDHSASIWAGRSDGTEIILCWQSEAGGQEQELAAAESGPRHLRWRIEGLKPSTAYRYRLRAAGRDEPLGQGRFVTAPPAGQPARFRLALSSCMKAEAFPRQPGFAAMLRESPDLHLLLGDNVYANSTDPAVLWRHHLAQRAVPEFAKLIRRTPTYAIWDDHDYGPNDSDGTASGKEGSLATFRDLFANPGAGLKDVPGAFYRFSWADVDFFVLDGRYHRSPDAAPDDQKKRMLGDGPFAWLAEGLKTSRARFKVLASGSTLNMNKNDSWCLYGFERRRLFDLIRREKIGGVIYLSGDIHTCLILRHDEKETVGYPLYEFISSGIAQTTPRGFVTLDFDTTLKDPSLRARILTEEGEVLQDETIVRSTLSARP